MNLWNKLKSVNLECDDSPIRLRNRTIMRAKPLKPKKQTVENASIHEELFAAGFIDVSSSESDDATQK
jgi:hypothetical protein